MKPSFALTAALLAVSATGLLFAQDTPKAKPAPARVQAPSAGSSPSSLSTALPASAIPAEDVKAIKDAVESFVKAFNAADAKAISLLFTENAEVTDEDGAMAVGKPAIIAQFEEAFKSRPGRKISIFSDTVKFFAADVAIEEGRAMLTPPDGGPAEHSRYSVVYVKKNGRWLQASIRDDHDHSLSPHEHLKPLAWMVGEWVNETENLSTATTCYWTPDKNYLIRDFTVKHGGKPEMNGTQRIGWDPLTKQIKSWVFDSDGGYGESFWSQEGGHWVVKATGVLPDGKTASATYHIEIEGKDKIRWVSVDRVVGGKPAADIEEIALVRKPPQAPPASGSAAAKSSP
jgi:uncharacterized protein (TIGR02246 family)